MLTEDEVKQIRAKAEAAIATDVLMLVAISGRVELIQKVDKLTTMLASKALTAGLMELHRIGEQEKVDD